jgi:hypothetical protein
MMDRKALVREYKETPRPMGVYRIRNTVSGTSLVASSKNLTANINRDQFQLKGGLHTNASLQRDWDELGPEAFEFEILDQLEPPELGDYDPTDDLRELEVLWCEKLSGEDLGYNSPGELRSR